MNEPQPDGRRGVLQLRPPRGLCHFSAQSWKMAPPGAQQNLVAVEKPAKGQ